jgi:hypothetical protein
MPLKKQQFVITEKNLAQAIDVDDSVGRSVPINMNFTDSGYLAKDTGTSLLGATDVTLRHSLFNYKKKNGTSFFITANGTKLQRLVGSTWTDIANNTSTTATITIATPAVITSTAHGFVAGNSVSFTTTGALPTGITVGTTYYVLSAGLTANDFQVSLTFGGTAVNTSGTQSGVHSVFLNTNSFTAGAYFGFIVYDDILYGCNGVESYFRWDGTTFTQYPTAPKGNTLEIFEDRMFISGSTTEPLTIYYSGVATPTTFSGTDIIKPLGTDFVQTLENYYGTLLIFKKETIWKLTFTYDQVVSLFVPKLELQSGTYGACSRKAVCWVENDLWFFTGQEVRSIGFKDQQLGVLGVNPAVISESIKETLLKIPFANTPLTTVGYNNRRFYLSVPLANSYNETTFVCHLLYKNAWTKYASRIKSQILDLIEVDDVLYSAKSATPYGVLKWDNVLLNDNGAGVPSQVFFRKVEDKDFNNFNTYRYLDLMFKNLSANVLVTLKFDANDLRYTKSKTFYVGNDIEDDLGAIGEVDVGEGLVADSYGQTIDTSPFIKKRLSFLGKSQDMIIGLSNSTAGETFNIAEYSLIGMKQPRKMFKPSGIISL